MNPNQPSREQIEARITALLLGELPTDEAALLRYTIAQDPALQQLHDELQATLVLVREAAKHPADAELQKSEALKLSAERRQNLLAHFKSGRTKTTAKTDPLCGTKTTAKAEPLFWLKRIEMPRLVPVLAAVALIAVLAAMLMPRLAGTSERARRAFALEDQRAVMAQMRAANSAPPPPTPVAAPAHSTLTVTLAPEPQLAPPPATPPVQIILPAGQRESGQLAYNDSGSAAGFASGVQSPEPALLSPQQIASQITAPRTSHVYSQHIVGYVNIPAGAAQQNLLNVPFSASDTSTPNTPAYTGLVPPPSETPAAGLTLSDSDGAKNIDKLARLEQKEKQWIVPGQAAESSDSTGGKGTGNNHSFGDINGTLRGFYDDGFGGGGQSGQNNGAVVGVVNAFSGAGGLRSTGQGGGGGGGGASQMAGMASPRNLDQEQRLQGVSGAAAEDAASERSLLAAQHQSEQKELRRSGNYEGFFTGTPAAGDTLALNHSGVDRSRAQNQLGTPLQDTAGVNYRLAPPPAPAATPLEQFPITATGQAASESPKVELYQPLANGSRAGVAGNAPANRYYRNPAQEAGKEKVPMLGDVPVMGKLIQSSPQSGKLEAMASPVLAKPVAPVVADTVNFAFDDSQSYNAANLKPTDKSVNGAFALAGGNTFAGRTTVSGGTVAINTTPAPGDTVTLGVNSGSFNNGVANENNPEWAGALEHPDAPHGPNNHFTSRYAFVTTNRAELDQFIATNAVAMNGGPRNVFATSPSPTLDAAQLQAINAQTVEGEKVYNEQLVQLQELKSLAKNDKNKLAEVLPQMVQDSELSKLLNRRHEAEETLATLGNDYPSRTETARVQSKIDELNREIDDRAGGIMAGLESKAATTKASLDALAAKVEEVKQKEQADAEQNQPYYDAQRNLQQKLSLHQMLYAKLEAEKLDLNLPEKSTVQLTDPAQPGRSQNAWQRLTGQVESKARIKVENDVTDIPGMNGSPTVASYDPYFIQTTFEIMQSEAVLGKVVDALNLQLAWAGKNGGQKLNKSQAIELLKQRLDLQPVKNTKLIEIAAKSNDPKESADIANAVARAYEEYRHESRRQLTGAGVKTLEDQFAQQDKEIRLAQAEVDRLSPKSTSEPAPAQTDLPLRKPAPNAPLPQPEILASSNAFSTFSLNVSDVSFKFAEASLQNGKLPDTASIRSEEFINAFDYRDPKAVEGQPMAFMSERARYPFAHNRELLRFAVKTAAAGRQAGRALNLVLLLDNSGSMERADRVAIIREALRVLATQLQPQDTVSVVTFARVARLWADGIPGDKAGATLDQVGGITPEGGTNLEEAMRLAYETAHRHYLAGGMNRVVLLTDGAANLGNVEPAALKRSVEAQRKQGIALDCFGIGWEDYNDDLLEQLSSNGDGRYAFLNSPEDASRDFAAKLAGALQIAAADVKVQVEFNPARVISYRQIGYATHQLTKEQFRDNTVAAGQIAAQEAGNALYTIETNPNGDGPIATVHVRYKVPGTEDYREHSWDVAYTGSAPALEQSSPAMRLAATASAFSEWLAASPYAQEVTLDELLRDLSGVPEIYGADDRPKQLETMIREAKSLEGR